MRPGRGVGVAMVLSLQSAAEMRGNLPGLEGKTAFKAAW